MGRNLFCVHSRKRMDDIPELKTEKMVQVLSQADISLFSHTAGHAVSLLHVCHVACTNATSSFVSGAAARCTSALASVDLLMSRALHHCDMHHVWFHVRLP